MAYPSSLDSFTTKQDSVDTILAAHVNSLQTSVVNVETYLGTNASQTAPVANRVLLSTSNGVSAWAQVDLTAYVTGNLPLANGGLGASLSDPNADRILFWDDSAGQVTWLVANTGLAISGTNLNLSFLGIEALTDPNADRILFWDDSAGATAWLTAGSGLSISGTTMTATGSGIGGATGSTDNALIRADGTGGSTIQATNIIVDDSDNIQFPAGAGIRTGTSDTNTLLIQARDVDGSAWTTFITLTAANTPTCDLASSVTIGGAAIYRVGGTDVSLADGGTGASLSDPNADRIMFWDDSAGQVTWLVPNTGLAISGTNLNLSFLGLEALTDPNADRILFWDDSAASLQWLTAGTGLSISGTTLTATGGSSDPLIWVVYDFSSTTRLEDGSGGGTQTLFENGLRLDTTATANRHANLRYALKGSGTPNYNWYGKAFEATFGCRPNTMQGTDFDTYVGIGLPTCAGGGITYSAGHIAGFKTNRASSGSVTLSATNANGTTETATDITGSYTLTDYHFLNLIFTPATNAKFYVDGTLAATHTTNLPTTNTDQLAAFQISNRNVATQSRLEIGTFLFKGAM